MKRSFVLKLIILGGLSACNSKVNNSLCDNYKIYYNPSDEYYVVSQKNTPSGFFYIWENSQRFYLKYLNNPFYAEGPFNTVSEAIEAEEQRPIFSLFTWNYFERSGNTLVEKETGATLQNLCE